MLVAVDGTPLQLPNRGGVARYVAGVVPALAAIEGVDVVLLVDGHRPRPVGLDGIRTEPVTTWRRLPRLAWLEVAAGRWHRRHDAVFVGTFYAVPLRDTGPSVVVLHDVAWVTHPEDFGALKRRMWALHARRSVARAAIAIAGSSFSASQVSRAYGVAPERIRVTPYEVDPVFVPHEAAATSDRYVVTLGGAPRRRLPEAVAAWRIARRAHPDVELVVVGAEAPPTEPGIRYVGTVDDGRLAELLAGAEAFVYATRFEGFGLPAAEAMACGAPVVCAPVGALPEVLGDAAAWSAAPSADALAERLTELLDDPCQRNRLRAAARRRAAGAPTWRDAAAVVVDACRKASAGG